MKTLIFVFLFLFSLQSVAQVQRVFVNEVIEEMGAYIDEEEEVNEHVIIYAKVPSYYDL